MVQNKVITINGRQYDAVTGLPIRKDMPATKAAAKPPAASTTKPSAQKVAAKTETAKPRASVGVKAVHGSTLQRSTTLRRRATKKPETSKPTLKPSSRGRSMDIAKSPKVAKFAPHPVVKPVAAKAVSTSGATKTASKAKPDKAPQAHYVAQKVIKKQEEKLLAKKNAAKPAPKPSAKQVKDEAIAKALATPKKKAAKNRKISPWKKVVVYIVLTVAIIFGVSYAVYTFIPSVSVSWAASQAGVKASYPSYVPDGFKLDQPVTYSEGEVLLRFASNSNDDNYTIRQSKSSWDSAAVLDNTVKPKAGDNYITTQERGLTIYVYENFSSWVNAGVLYTIESNSQLSNEQIRRIATSL